MKKLLIMSMAVLLISPLAFARDVPVKFAWDPNTEPDMKQYVLYHHIEGNGYNYEIPIKIIPCTVTNGKCLTDVAVPDMCSTEISLTVPDGEKVTGFFVMRAEDGVGNQSGDSNEVSDIFDLTPLLATADLTAIYNKDNQTIDFTWTQSNVDRIKYWEVYSSETTGGPFAKIATVQWDGEDTSISSSIPAGTLLPGASYFAVVGFDRYGIFSPNSNEVRIDREPPTKVINLRLILN